MSINRYLLIVLFTQIIYIYKTKKTKQKNSRFESVYVLKQIRMGDILK